MNRQIPQPAPGSHDAYLAAYAADQGISVDEATVRIGAMTQVIDVIIAAAQEGSPASYDRFEPFGLGSIDTEGSAVKVVSELADMATTAVGLLTKPPYPSFDVKGYAYKVVAAFGMEDPPTGGTVDVTAVPVAWWRTPLGRLTARAIRGD